MGVHDDADRFEPATIDEWSAWRQMMPAGRTTVAAARASGTRREVVETRAARVTDVAASSGRGERPRD